eukprot:15449269-Alexandrium_andersonii.AAC.1
MASRRTRESSEGEPSTADHPIRARASVADRSPNCRSTSQTAGHQTSKRSDPNSPMPQRGQGS